MRPRSRVLVRVAVGLVAATLVPAAAVVTGRDRAPVGPHPTDPPAEVADVPSATSPPTRIRQAPPGSKPGYDPTVAACTGARAFDALFYGSGPVCAPWDSIPAIDAPELVPAGDVEYVAPDEAVIALDLGGEHRAYPVQVLLFHEIVNDVVGQEPVAVTFCPLCNSAVAFSRRVAGDTLVFGVSGQLNFANLLMFDRQTSSLWRQLTGEAVEGPYEGSRLTMLPARLVSFGEWRAEHPDGLVLARPLDTRFSYGIDPYRTYGIDPDQPSVVLRGLPVDPRLPPKWRVVGVAGPHGAVAFPSPATGRRPVVVTARLGPLRLVAFFRYGVGLPETTYEIAEQPHGWSATVWVARSAGRPLRFAVRDGRFVERTTGSVFGFFGRGLRGALEGATLRSIPQATAFWFAWSEFHPRTLVARLPFHLRPRARPRNRWRSRASHRG